MTAFPFYQISIIYRLQLFTQPLPVNDASTPHTRTPHSREEPPFTGEQLPCRGNPGRAGLCPRIMGGIEGNNCRARFYLNFYQNFLSKFLFKLTIQDSLCFY